MFQLSHHSSFHMLYQQFIFCLCISHVSCFGEEILHLFLIDFILFPSWIIYNPFIACTACSPDALACVYYFFFLSCHLSSLSMLFFYIAVALLFAVFPYWNQSWRSHRDFQPSVHSVMNKHSTPLWSISGRFCHFVWLPSMARFSSLQLTQTEPWSLYLLALFLETQKATENQSTTEDDSLVKTRVL